MKKALSLALALCLVAGLAVPALAADAEESQAPVIVPSATAWAASWA